MRLSDIINSIFRREPKKLSTSQVIDAAADQLEGRAWAKSYGWNWFAEPNMEVCLEGALLAGMNAYIPEVAILTDKETATAAGLEAMTMSDLQSCPAYVAVSKYLEEHPPPPWSVGRELWQYNDRYATSKEDVVNLLRNTAAAERDKENTSS